MRGVIDLPINNWTLYEWLERNYETLTMAFIERHPEDFWNRDQYVDVERHPDFDAWLQSAFDAQAERENALCAVQP